MRGSAQRIWRHIIIIIQKNVTNLLNCFTRFLDCHCHRSPQTDGKVSSLIKQIQFIIGDSKIARSVDPIQYRYSTRESISVRIKFVCTKTNFAHYSAHIHPIVYRVRDKYCNLNRSISPAAALHAIHSRTEFICSAHTQPISQRRVEWIRLAHHANETKWHVNILFFGQKNRYFAAVDWDSVFKVDRSTWHRSQIGSSVQ